MRIATWNLDRSRPGIKRKRQQDAMAQIKDIDVWVLTESFRDLAPGPDYELKSYSSDAVLDRDSEHGECWVTIWTRKDAAIKVQLKADLERAAAVRLVDSGVVVVGTVLPWLTDDRHPEVRGEAAFLARLSEQSEDWLRLRDEASGELCVAGDFNQDLLSEGHYYGSGGGRTALRDAFHKCGLDCLTGGKDDPLAGHAGLASVDHIAITGLRAVGERRSTVWPAPGTLNRTLLSDHYGVWAEVVQV